MFCQRIIRSNAHRLVFFQNLSLTTENVQPKDNKDGSLDDTTKKKPIKRSSGYSRDVYNYLQNQSKQYTEFIPTTFMRRSNLQSNKLFIIQEESAKKLATMISKELLNDCSHVIEFNPGLGLMTKELLKAGVPFIHLYENNKLFYDKGPLSQLLKEYPNKLKHKEVNSAHFWKLALRDEFFCEQLAEPYIGDVQYCEWKSNTCMQIIVFAPNRNIIALIVYNFFKQTSLFTHGRPCFYIAVPAQFWNNLTILENNRFYSQYSVMLHLFFDVQHLGELPREVFIPWPREKYWKMDNLDTPVCIIKLEPKKNVFDLLSKDDIRSFWYFLKYCMKTNKSKVLAEFEKFVPGSGAKLVQRDIGILTSFKDLPPEKLLEIFKMYRSWPEYDEFIFNPTLSAAEEKKIDERHEGEEDESIEQFEQESVDTERQALPTEVKQESN